MITAVRRSGAAFTGAYNVRSECFDDYLLKRDLLTKRAGELREQLVAELYARISVQKNNCARAALLAAKRSIFNGRLVSPAYVSRIAEISQRDDPAGAMIEEYNAALGAISDLHSTLRAPIIAEIKEKLRALANQPRFRSAVNYACPWLIEAYERKAAARDDGDFSDEERGLFGYGVKFFSKANPLHFFASIGIPSEPAGELCEIVIDTGFILRLEQAALAARQDTDCKYVYLRPHLKDGEWWRFLVENREKSAIVSVKNHPILAGLASILSDSPGPRSLGECEDALQTGFGAASREGVRKYLATLLDRNVLVEYLVSDFRRFAGQLAGWNPDGIGGGAPALEAGLESLGKWHLKPLSEASVMAIESELRAMVFPVAGRPAYFVNSYCSSPIDMPPAEMAERIGNDLRYLKTFLTAMPNTAGRAGKLQRLLLSRLRQYPAGGEVPYLKVLYDCLRNRQPDEVLETIDDSGVRPEWLASLGNLAGEITASDLTPLRLDKDDVPGICCNGPIDYRSGRFFPANLFSGGGRFLSRYFLYQGPGPFHGLREDGEEAIDVQLAPPLRDSRLFVKSQYPVGCGFDSRYRFHFEQWIDPSEIHLEIHGASVRYRHATRGKLLRFHYSGFLFSEFLTMEYALLMLDHADTYTNPFCVQPKTEVVDSVFGGGGVVRVLELVYGAICLRRAELRIPAAAIHRILNGKDLLLSAVQFRDGLHLLSGSAAEHWYVRAPRAGKGGWKPRYLDLRNALSIDRLRRDLASLPADAVAAFSRMDPPVENLPMDGDGRFCAEFMIEV